MHCSVWLGQITTSDAH